MLTVTGAGGINTCTQPNYITVYTAPKANFFAAPGPGEVPLQVNFTNESAGVVTSWLWHFGDGEKQMFFRSLTSSGHLSHRCRCSKFMPVMAGVPRQMRETLTDENHRKIGTEMEKGPTGLWTRVDLLFWNRSIPEISVCDRNKSLALLMNYGAYLQKALHRKTFFHPSI
jgi:hypothetical protein